MKKIFAFVIMMFMLVPKGEAFLFDDIGTDPGGTFEAIFQEATLKEGVREISYKQFLRLRKSGEEYVLLDVLLSDSYNERHIPGALNFPVNEIDEETAGNMLSKDANIVVYCGSFRCAASTTAARKFSALGYKVVDYKGGLKEWQEKGNPIAGNPFNDSF